MLLQITSANHFSQPRHTLEDIGVTFGHDDIQVSPFQRVCGHNGILGAKFPRKLILSITSVKSTVSNGSPGICSQFFQSPFPLSLILRRRVSVLPLFQDDLLLRKGENTTRTSISLSLFFFALFAIFGQMTTICLQQRL